MSYCYASSRSLIFVPTWKTGSAVMINLTFVSTCSCLENIACYYVALRKDMLAVQTPISSSINLTKSKLPTKKKTGTEEKFIVETRITHITQKYLVRTKKKDVLLWQQNVFWQKIVLRGNRKVGLLNFEQNICCHNNKFWEVSHAAPFKSHQVDFRAFKSPFH